MAEFTCARCGEAFEASSPRAKFCSDLCRKRQQRAPVEVGASEFPTADAYARELREVDRLDSAAGATVIALARILDAPGETGSAKASAAKQLQAAMAEALAGVKVAGDPLDELAERRARRSG